MAMKMKFTEYGAPSEQTGNARPLCSTWFETCESICRYTRTCYIGRWEICSKGRYNHPANDSTCCWRCSNDCDVTDGDAMMAQLFTVR